MTIAGSGYLNRPLRTEDQARRDAMLELRNKPIEALPTATVRVLRDGRASSVTGKVVGRTFERDPMLDIRLDDGAIVRVRKSEAEIEQ